MQKNVILPFSIHKVKLMLKDTYNWKILFLTKLVIPVRIVTKQSATPAAKGRRNVGRPLECRQNVDIVRKIVKIMKTPAGFSGRYTDSIWTRNDARPSRSLSQTQLSRRTFVCIYVHTYTYTYIRIQVGKNIGDRKTPRGGNQAGENRVSSRKSLNRRS